MALDLKSLEKQEYDIPKGTKIAICVASYYSDVTYPMRDLCKKTLLEYGIKDADINIIEAYGAFELPYLAQKAAETKKFSAIITLGCIIKGGTPHFDFVALGTTQGIIEVSLKHSIPVIFGVLTTSNHKQAVDRITKGQETALAALKLISNNF